MLYALSATASFEASHVIAGHELCGRQHGHSWHVTAQVAHEEMDGGYPRGSQPLRESLALLSFELAGRDLDKMLPDFEATPTALAAWFFERLAADYKGLTRVEVWNPLESGIVEKPLT